ncbi:MAG: Eco57I restriction-modification methylase domain-containing protein [Melioribacteraceae bacterium]|nr:Eco57I restriction-modification methylase domain-containing protein [Melioribacteraceae bacterium]
MTKYESAFAEVSILVQDFKENESKYLSPAYSEVEVRKDFIDKFFHALGWDVYHNEQKNPYEQELKIEKSVSIERAQKRADYAFYIAPNFRDVKFYLEAKKPSRNLLNADNYFQSCRYGWNSQTEITFLFDFEELHIIDCRLKPDITTILNNKIKQYHYSDYTDKEKFSEIYWLISREAVANNSLQKFAESLPKPKGKTSQKGLHKGLYQSIDEAFLIELDEIRDTLAKSFKRANPNLESGELTEMTQRTIDRLVFIRFLEDKQIEPEHYISVFGKSKNAWKDFRNVSRKLDAKYNGVVFKKHFVDSDDFIEPSDKSFSQICDELSHVNSPYNFDIIPIHILGSIYERFLGKVVIATDKRVRIEEKPEVRKAGGVYYTPQYIVNYIVDNTVGKQIEGKTPIEIAKLSFADISCGSGSFLITVFDRLLEYHRKWYQENEAQAKKDGCYFQDGKWILSLKQKQKILTNNIYGVDLDSQAVEVTQLSLYLKLLEDETTATAQDTWVMFKEQLLPNLKNNIICGNSLIGTDILEGGLFKREDELKLKPMNFEDAFPEIMKSGGFDAIVGNPPYVRNRELDIKSKNYFKYNYLCIHGQYDLYQLFYERAIKIIKNYSFIGYISSNKFSITNYGYKLRDYILKTCEIEKIIDVSNMDVFKEVSTYPYIVIIKKSHTIDPLHHIISLIAQDQDDLINPKYFSLSQTFFSSSTTKNFIIKIIPQFFEKFETNTAKLGDIASIKETIHTGNIRDKLIGNKYINDNSKRLLAGKDVHRYWIEWKNRFVNYDSKIINKNNGEYASLPDKKYFESPKILMREIANQIECYYDDQDYYSLNKAYSVQLLDDTTNFFYLLGVLNSKLLSYFFRIKFEEAHVRGGYLQFKKLYTSQLPIKLININNDREELLYNQLIEFVAEIQESKRFYLKSKTESERNYLEKKCISLDRQIDNLVYELYGLTEEEIKIVEST